MGYVKWSYDTLNTFCHDVFRKFGFNEEQTNIIKDVLPQICTGLRVTECREW